MAAPQPKEGAPLAEPSKSLYWQGHEALGKRDWSGALQLFRHETLEIVGLPASRELFENLRDSIEIQRQTKNVYGVVS